MVPAKNAVMAPNTVTTARMSGAYSNSGEQRAIKNTPAVTRVAAWIKAETGVGAAIAFGSHTCNPICALFPTAPTNSSPHIKFNVLNSNVKNVVVESTKAGAAAKIVA